LLRKIFLTHFLQHYLLPPAANDIPVSLTVHDYVLGYGFFAGLGFCWDMEMFRIKIVPEYVVDKTNFDYYNEPLFMNNFRLRFVLMLKK